MKKRKKNRKRDKKWVGGRLVGRKKEGKEFRSMSIRSQKKTGRRGKTGENGLEAR